MSGHNKWSQIKHKKGAADAKRGNLFAKLLRAISIAAKAEPNPQFNPRLRSAVEKARENLVPSDNIEKAISKASEQKDLSEMVIEAYGPEGAAIIVTAVTDNTNRTIAEVKKILSDHDAKFANPGSVLWAFNAPIAGNPETEWKAKFPQKISEAAEQKMEKLIEDLDAHDDVQDVFTNIE